MPKDHPTKKQPNIIFFIADQWRGDVLGHAGNPAAQTPNLDQLVQTDAVSFLQAFCQNPVCTPSRCSFLTGWYPHVRGHRTMNHLLQPDEPCMLRDLKNAGYHVWWGGKNDAVAGAENIQSCYTERHAADATQPSLHFDQKWRTQSPDGKPDFSFYAGRLEKNPGETLYFDSDWSHTLAARDFILEHPKEQPFCIYLSLQYPHPPYGVEDPYFSQIDRSLLPRRAPEGNGKPRLQGLIRERQNLSHLTEEQWTELRATYYGQCARVDHQLGLLLEALKAAGTYDDTALFFFADHGDYTGDYGIVEKAQNLFEDCLTRVPLVIKPPAALPVSPGCRDALTELIDIVPTVYQLTGTELKHDQFGKSLLPLFDNATAAHREAAFCEGGIRQGDPVEPAHNDPGNLYWPRVSLSVDDSLAYGRAIMCRTHTRKYILRINEPCELYDLGKDPQETRNVADDPAYAEDAAQLRNRLLQFLWETADIVPKKTDPRDA